MTDSWKSKVPGCFGESDLSFAVHPNDEDRAFDLLKELRTEKIGRLETRNAITQFLTSKNASPDHVRVQLAKVDEYFCRWLLD